MPLSFESNASRTVRPLRRPLSRLLGRFALFCFVFGALATSPYPRAFGDERTIDATTAVQTFSKDLVRMNGGLTERASRSLAALLKEETLGQRYIVRVEGNGAPRTHCLDEPRPDSESARISTSFSCEMFAFDIFRTSSFPEVSSVSYISAGSAYFGADATITPEKRVEWRTRLGEPSLTTIAAALETSRPEVINFAGYLALELRRPFVTDLTDAILTGPESTLRRHTNLMHAIEPDLQDGQIGTARLRGITSLIVVLEMVAVLGVQSEVDFGFENIVKLQPAVSASN